MYANEAMSSNVVVCNAGDNLDDVSRLMWENNCGAIPIVNSSDKPIGIVTDRDIAMAGMLNHQPLWEINAEVLSNNQRLYSAHQESTLEDCLSIMEQNGVRRLPIVNEDGTIAGILSMGDAIAFAEKKASRSKQSKTISFDSVMGMMKKVSAHHKSKEQAIAKV